LKADLTTPWVRARLSIAPGEVVALVGPNGAGKSTLLRALAGLQPATGSVELGGRDVSRLPPYDRAIGWVPQERVLFPHLSVLENVAFGLRARRCHRDEARAEARHWLERLGVAGLASRRPRELSGGQAARVALARALAPRPDLVLLDEPLASLDVDARDDVRRLLRRTLSGGPAAVLVVTHDAVDVVALADRVVVLQQGEVAQDGTPAELTRSPRTTWLAGLLGQNAWRGTTDAHGLAVDGGGHVATAEQRPPGRDALALVEPAAVTLHRRRPEGSARNVLEGPVLETRTLGSRVRVVVGSTPPVTAEVTLLAAGQLELAERDNVFASFKATEVRLVDV
jgi:molybdate transport system permease protein